MRIAGALVVAGLALAASAPLSAQSSATLTPPTAEWTAPRTAGGQPDVHGSYVKDWIGARGPNFDLEEGQDPEEMRATGRESLDQAAEIIQTPGFVFFEYPYNSVVRTIYLDERAPLNDRVKLWYGDARGRWEGNTLIVLPSGH